MNLTLRLLPLLAALASPLAATTTIILNDTFADGNRTGQSLPDSARWFATNNSAVAVSNQAVQLTGSANPHLLAYVPKVSLAIGESVTLSYDVTFTGPGTTTAGFRAGLFDSSASTKITGDSFSGSDNRFVPYTGYFTGATLSGSSTPLRFYERSNQTGSLIASSIGNHTALGTAGGGAKTFATGAIYTASFSILWVEENLVQLTSSFTGIFAGDTEASTLSIVRTDTATLKTAFDTIAFYVHGATAATTVELDNVMFAYTAIPEPSSLAVLAAGAALGAVALRRRRAA